GTNEILRLLIGGSGLSYAGKELQHLLRKVKDPRYALPVLLNHNARYIKQSWSSSPPVGFLHTDRASVDEKSMHLPNLVRLSDHLHPQLHKTADQLAKYILNFQSLSRSLLRLHGHNLVNQQIDVLRAADFVIDIFMIACCLSRCSRSLSIGLPRAEHEQAANCANLHRVAVFFRTKPDETGLLKKIADRLEGFEKAQNKAKFTEAARLLAWMQQPVEDSDISKCLDQLHKRLFEDEPQENVPTTSQDSEMPVDYESTSFLLNCSTFSLPTEVEEPSTLKKETNDAICFKKLGPRLQQIALGLAGVRPTSIDSERVFSVAGGTKTKVRSRISPRLLDTLLFVKFNYDFLNENFE
ncbi:hypothetical protein Ciccas_010976, partial [Cichlidogyrus casuarinus]